MTLTRQTALQHRTLEGLSSAVNYRTWICDLAEPWLGDRALEIGSGTGDYAEHWRQPGRSLTVSEQDPALVEHLRHRFAGCDTTVRQLSLPAATTDAFTGVVAVNVLEHVREDVAALATMRDLCAPGGHVVLFVPAFELGMSRFDREIGHHRRYRRGTLVRHMEQVGLDVQTAHYVNMPGLIAWVLLMRALGGRPDDGPALRAFERLVPHLRALEARIRVPFGQSVFAVGRRA